VKEAKVGEQTRTNPSEGYALLSGGRRKSAVSPWEPLPMVNFSYQKGKRRSASGKKARTKPNWSVPVLGGMQLDKHLRVRGGVELADAARKKTERSRRGGWWGEEAWGPIYSPNKTRGSPARVSQISCS